MNANLRNFALWVIIVLLLLALFTLSSTAPSMRRVESGRELQLRQYLTLAPPQSFQSLKRRPVVEPRGRQTPIRGCDVYRLGTAAAQNLNIQSFG